MSCNDNHSPSKDLNNKITPAFQMCKVLKQHDDHCLSQDPQDDFLDETDQLVPSMPSSSSAVQQSMHSNLVEQLHDSYTAMDGAFDLDIISCVTGDKILGLPKRYLPHQSLSNLYWIFTSVWDNTYARLCTSGATCPSFSTFQKRWRVWKHRLKLRKSSQHAQCTTCHELQLVLRANNKTWGEKVQAARQLRVHYTLQYQDRCLYWSLRWFSRHGSDVLCIIIDGMDRAKFCWPKIPGRMSKDIVGFNRPRTVLTACRAHGHCTILFMSNEQLNHGAEFFCEILVRTIEQVFKQCVASGRPFPRHLVLQNDNAPGQAKKQYAFKLFAYLTAAFKFVSVTANFLMVGHTHEDVDQLFALVLWLLVRKDSFQTPDEILRFLEKSLVKYHEDLGEQLLAVQLTAVRNFTDWLWPLDLTLDKGFKTRAGIESAHSFAFKHGMNMSAVEKKKLREEGAEIHQKAVYCSVKAYMRDTEPQQAPILCVPEGREKKVTGLALSPTTVMLRKELSPADIKNWLSLAEAYGRVDLPVAKAALRDAVYKKEAHIPPLPWLETFKQPCMQMPTGDSSNVQFPHLPKSTWKLVATVGE